MWTVVDLIRAATRGNGELSVLDDDGEIAATLSWAELHDRARRMAAGRSI